MKWIFFCIVSVFMLVDLVWPRFCTYPVISNIEPALNQMLNRIKYLLTICLQASPCECTSYEFPSNIFFLLLYEQKGS